MNSNQITIASQDLARRLAQARGEIDYYAPQGGGSRQYPAVVTTTREERQEITTTRQSQLARLQRNFVLPAHDEEKAKPQTSIQIFTEAIKRAFAEYGIDCKFEMYVDWGDQYALSFSTKYFGLSDEQMIALQYIGDQLRNELSEPVRTGFEMIGRYVRLCVWIMK